MKSPKIMELKIDQEFSARLPKLNPDEYQRLEKSIKAEDGSLIGSKASLWRLMAAHKYALEDASLM